jgi:hypothetical protein
MVEDKPAPSSPMEPTSGTSGGSTSTSDSSTSTSGNSSADANKTEDQPPSGGPDARINIGH